MCTYTYENDQSLKVEYVFVEEEHSSIKQRQGGDIVPSQNIPRVQLINVIANEERSGVEK